MKAWRVQRMRKAMSEGSASPVPPEGAGQTLREKPMAKPAMAVAALGIWPVMKAEKDSVCAESHAEKES